jgi:hypothetical protein
LRKGRFLAATALAFTSVFVVAVDNAYAAVTLSVTPDTSLADGQSVQITVAGINAVPFASVEISQCGNAHANGTPLLSLHPSTDCKVLAGYDVSSSPTLVTNLEVMQEGIGTAGRSCIHASEAVFPCDVRISQMKNQSGSTLPSPAPIEFANDITGGTPAPTTTTAAAVGAPVATGKTAWAHVVVTSSRLDQQGKPFIPEGNVTVELDSVEAGSAPLTIDLANGVGSANVALGTPSIGTHDVIARFVGNGSFEASSSSSSSFSVIGQKNVTIGDTTVIEGDAGNHSISFPVVLSVPDPAQVQKTTVGYTIHSTTATVGSKTAAGTDVVAATGTIKFGSSATIRYVTARVLGDASVEGNETFTVDLTAPNNGYVLRRSQAIGTIVDDDPTPGLEVGVGDATVPEGDVGGSHAVRVPLTLSAPQLTPVTVTVVLTSSDAVHTRTGDWGGAIMRNFKFAKNQVYKAISIPTYPDTKDEQDLHITVQVVSTTAGTIGKAIGTATILTDE